jgi:hypothetical protein
VGVVVGPAGRTAARGCRRGTAVAKNVDDYLERRFVQDEHLGRADIAFLLNFAPDARNGVCQALAQYWVRLKLRELTAAGGRTSPRDRVAAVAADDVLVGAIELFNSFAGNHHLRVQAGARKYGLVCHKGQSLCAYNKGHGNKALIDTVTGAKNACHLIHFSFTRQGGTVSHVIACYCSSGKVLGVGRHVYLFDPNHGEYKVPKPEFRAWWWQEFLTGKYRVRNIGDVGDHYEVYPYVLAPEG